MTWPIKIYWLEAIDVFIHGTLHSTIVITEPFRYTFPTINVDSTEMLLAAVHEYQNV